MDGQSATSDEYVIFTPSGQETLVFCDFYHQQGVSYTYLPPTTIDTIDTSTLKTLHNKRLENVDVRLLFGDGGQVDYVVEQLGSFKNKYPLDVQINDAVGYWLPVNHDVSSYLYLGLQPEEAAPASTTDKTTNPMFGYQANGVNFRFLNCNQLAKSFFAIFVNSTAFQNSSNYEWYAY